MPAGIKKKTKSSANVGKSSDCNSLPSTKNGKASVSLQEFAGTHSFYAVFPSLLHSQTLVDDNDGIAKCQFLPSIEGGGGSFISPSLFCLFRRSGR